MAEGKQRKRRKFVRESFGPYKFDQDRAERIVRLIRMGNFTEVAAGAAGIKPDTLKEWLKRGARGESPELVKFNEDFQRASFEAETLYVQTIAAVGMQQRNAKAAAWYLERKHPERWGRRDKVTHENPDGTAVAMSPSVVLYLPKNGRDITPEDAAAKSSLKDTDGGDLPED